jgi:putative heme-binding domain-containing protein
LSCLLQSAELGFQEQPAVLDAVGDTRFLCIWQKDRCLWAAEGRRVFCEEKRMTCVWSGVRVRVLALLVVLGMNGVPLWSREPAGPRLQLKPGDHISIIGNALADRMQHDGWLETYLHTRFPQLDLTFRNLAFPGDTLTVRFRSENFGSPDDWLTRTQADVVFAFFGYNESFGDEAGLPQFRRDLEEFIKHTLSQKYNGRSAPRLVLFSPIAHENLHNPHLPDGRENNRRLERYTQVMAEVARAYNIPFVDLFHATKELYTQEPGPFTINGIHLNERGNQAVARLIDQLLFPGPAPDRPTEWLEKVRQAVRERNFYWFQRYRTVDGYNVYGGRSKLRYTDGISNYEVMQREMQVLDVMTANRDRRIWAVARGGDLSVDDSNTPPFIPVRTNKPGPLPGGKHLFVDGAKAIELMTVGQGLQVNLFASEKEFPDLVNPVQMEFDPQGRLWVAVWPTYPHWKPKEEMNDKLLVFEDTDGDGKADKVTVFADHLHCPTGFTFYNGGVLVAQAPDILFLKDTDGDGKADLRIRMLNGIDSADTHHTANSFVFGPGGDLFFQEGIFHHTSVETPYGPPVRCANAGVFRFEPRTWKFETYIDFGFANPHGHVFDRWGQDIVIDGTGANPYQAALFSGQVDFPHRHNRPPQVYAPKTRPCPGAEILSSRHFPPEMQGNLLVANVIGFQGILRYRLEDRGAGIVGIEQEPILSSRDPNFRPSDIRIGPDGAIYFTDWHNPIIGHMQHHIRDPNRDREHGRIYRVTYRGRPLLRSPKIAGEPVERLLELLQEPEDRVRYRVRLELSGRDSQQVLAAIPAWLARLDRKDPNYEHHLMEALWLYQAQDVVQEDLLRRLLRSPDFHARAAATRVLCYWRDRVPQALALLRQQIHDEHPRVRLEAIRALSFFPVHRGDRQETEAALAIAVELLAQPDDPYLRFVFNETLNTLERRLGGGRLDRSNLAASLLRLLEQEKLPAPRQAVLLETICRHGSSRELQAVWQRVQAPAALPPELRRQVLSWLAEAARTRRVRPAVPPAAVTLLLTETQEPQVLKEAIALAVAWRVTAALPTLQELARQTSGDPAVRSAAIHALAILGGHQARKTLEELSQPPHAPEVRFQAAAALAHLDLPAAATAAAKALAASTEADDPAPLLEAFLVRKQGPEQLAQALLQNKVPADVAKRLLRALFLAGRTEPPLAEVVSKLAGIEGTPRPPTPPEVQQLAAEALRRGDPVRGEHVFRRPDLGCLKCHALNKAGGHVGPDLGPIGASSPMDYIITSILDPNASIKEEYLTRVISTSNGQVFTGIVVQRDKNQVVLKEATGKLRRIPTADIEEEQNGKSLMPEGITRILTHAELLDLIRFVSELGKPGPFAPPAVPTVLRWKRLRQVPAELREGVPHRDLVREYLLQAPAEAWEEVFAQVNGQLPLAENRKLSPEQVDYLQGEFRITASGPVVVRVQSTVPVTFWIDEEVFEKQAEAVVTLPTGRHRLTLRVLSGAAAQPQVRATLQPAPASTARVEVLQEEGDAHALR